MTTLTDIKTELSNTDSTFGINDRGQMYLQVHALNNSAGAVLEGNISTFSGFVGGTAYLANYVLVDKSQFGDGAYSYAMTPTAGVKDIYQMSQFVAAGFIDASILNGTLSVGDGIDAARDTWDGQTLLDQFPGNVFQTLPLVDNWPLPIPLTPSDGEDAGYAGALGSILFGKSITDFTSEAGYALVNGPDEGQDFFYGIQHYVLHYDTGVTGAVHGITGDRNDNGLLDYNDGIVAMLDNERLDVGAHLWEVAVEEGLAIFALAHANLGSTLYAKNLDWTAYRSWELLQDFRVQLVEGGEYDFQKYARDHGAGAEKDFWGYAEALLGDTYGVVRNAVFAHDRTQTGTSGDDYLYGGSGEDILYGENGADLIRSGWGDDSVSGGAGSDILVGELGDDDLTGGAGNDTYVIGPYDGTDAIHDSGDINTARLGDVRLSSVYLTKDGDDLLLKRDVTLLPDATMARAVDHFANGGTIQLLEVVNGAGVVLKGIDLSLISADITTSDFSIANVYTVLAGAPDVTGHVTNDRLYGDSSANILTGARGDDVLKGGAGADTYAWVLGDGSDTIVDTWGTGEKFSLGPGITREMLGIDDVGSDLVLTVTNAAGTAYSGTITLKDAASLETTFIANHVDNIIYEANPSTSTYLWGTYDEVLEEYFDEEDVIDGSDGVNDHIDGQDHDDILSGLSGDDFIEGGAGKSDVLNGGAGNDRLEDYDGGTLNGGADNDTLIGGYNATSYGAGSTMLNGGSGNDIISAVGNGTFNINGGDDHDIISVMHTDAVATVDGGAGNDTLYLRNDSTVVASAGNDIIFHAWGQGSQTTIQFDATWTLGTDITVAYSQNGRDLIVTHPDGTIMLVDFKDRPTSWLGKIGSAGTPFNFSDIELSYVYTGTESIVFGSSQELNVAAITTAAGNDSIDLNIDTDDVTIATGAGQDAVTVTGDNITINTGDDIDVINSSYGDHAIIAGSGADTIAIYQSRGTLDAGTGDDVVTVNMLSGETFTVDLGSGNDSITWQFGEGTIHGGDGDDIFDITYGDNLTVYGDAGNDTFVMSNLAAEIHGGDGDDVMTGSNGVDSAMYGDAGNDTITGLSGNDILRGGAGLDIIAGGAGNDDIEGGDDADTIHGNEDNDTIDGDGGNDVLYGDDGNDTINGGTGADTINGGAHSDIIHGNDGNDILVGGGGDDVLTGDTIYGDDGDDTITATSGYNYLYGGLGVDTITGGDDGNTIEGNEGNDILTGGAGANGIYGGDGDDTIVGGAGGGTLDGGDGVDSITGGAGLDTVNGGAGVDTIYTYGDVDGINAGDGDDIVYAGVGNDSVHGDGGADTVYGEDGNDIIEGETGNDIIYGGIGTDQLRGEDDDDTLYGEADNDTLVGGAGNDILDGGTGNDTMIGNTGDDTYYVDHAFDIAGEMASEGTDTVIASVNISSLYSNVENLTFTGATGRTGTGNALDNIITGTIAADTLNGGAGNDTLNGGEGNDILDGGADNDIITGGAGDDRLVSSSGNDTVIGGLDSDTLFVGASVTLGQMAFTRDPNGNDLILTIDGTRTITIQNQYALTGGVATLRVETVEYGSSAATIDLSTLFPGEIQGSGGDDTLYGTSAGETLRGYVGGDYLNADAGNDTLYGDDGNDSLYGGDGTNIIYGGAGNDFVYGSQNYGSSDFDTIDGEDGADNITGSWGADIISGGNDADTINGSLGSDTIHGGAGNDVINGGDDAYFTGPDDTIYGEDGNDTINGGSGDDTIYGGDGNDIITGGQGQDILIGGIGDDTYYADSITETITENANEGIDTVYIKKNLYTLAGNVENLIFQEHSVGFTGYANALDNIVTGTSKNDTLHGLDGNDIITGGGGNDTINGGNNNDTLNMGLGTDTVSGGSGADIFAFESGSTTTDTITDFSALEGDKINIANLLGAYDPLQDLISDFVSYSVSGGNTTLSVDASGGGSYAALATLTGVSLTGTVADLVTNGQLQVE